MTTFNELRKSAMENLLAFSEEYNSNLMELQSIKELEKYPEAFSQNQYLKMMGRFEELSQRQEQLLNEELDRECNRRVLEYWFESDFISSELREEIRSYDELLEAEEELCLEPDLKPSDFDCRYVRRTSRSKRRKKSFFVARQRTKQSSVVLNAKWQKCLREIGVTENSWKWWLEVHEKHKWQEFIRLYKISKKTYAEMLATESLAIRAQKKEQRFKAG